MSNVQEAKKLLNMCIEDTGDYVYERIIDRCKKCLEYLESETADKSEAGELNLSDEFVEALINDINQASRLEKMPNKHIIELLTNRVWGKLSLMTLESNLIDEAISRLEKIDSLEERRANASFLLRKAEEKLRGKSKTITKLAGDVAAKDEALEHIIEYWNKDRNDKAMHDALWHIIETAEQALPPKETDG